MVRGQANITIDTNVLELIRIHRLRNPNWSLSREIENYLKTFFSIGSEGVMQTINAEEVLEEELIKAKKLLAETQSKLNSFKENKVINKNKEEEELREYIRKVREKEHEIK